MKFKSNFRTYDLAVAFYHAVAKQPLPSHLRSQLLRAASSVPLNLKEGAAMPTLADRQKFYYIAMGSFRECQAVLDLTCNQELDKQAYILGAHLYKLCMSAGR